MFSNKLKVTQKKNKFQINVTFSRKRYIYLLVFDKTNIPKKFHKLFFGKTKNLINFVKQITHERICREILVTRGIFFLNKVLIKFDCLKITSYLCKTIEGNRF